MWNWAVGRNTSIETCFQTASSAISGAQSTCPRECHRSLTHFDNDDCHPGKPLHGIFRFLQVALKSAELGCSSQTCARDLEAERERQISLVRCGGSTTPTSCLENDAPLFLGADWPALTTNESGFSAAMTSADHEDVITEEDERTALV